MNHRLFAAAAVMLLFIAWTTGCAGLQRALDTPDVDPEQITDAASLVTYLHENRLALMEHGPFTSPLMTTPGYEYTPMTGGTLCVFKYPNGADALAAVAWVEEQREVKYPPHLYRKEDLVVVYWGDDPRMERALVRVFGSRVA